MTSQKKRLEPGTSSRALCGVALELNGQRALVVVVVGWERFVFIAGVFVGRYMIEKSLEIYVVDY